MLASYHIKAKVTNVLPVQQSWERVSIILIVSNKNPAATTPGSNSGHVAIPKLVTCDWLDLYHNHILWWDNSGNSPDPFSPPQTAVTPRKVGSVLQRGLELLPKDLKKAFKTAKTIMGFKVYF